MDQDVEETKQDVDSATPGATSAEETKASEKKVDVVLHTDEDVAKIRAEESARWQSIRDKERAGFDEAVKERDKLRAESEEHRRQEDDAELKRAQEEGPEALDILQRRRAAREEIAQSARAKAEAEAKIAEATDIVQWRIDRAIAEAAKETGVSEEDIRFLAPLSLEEVKKAADIVVKFKAPGVPTKPPDPGVSSGGVGWRDLTAEEKLKYAIEHPPKK